MKYHCDGCGWDFEVYGEHAVVEEEPEVRVCPFCSYELDDEICFDDYEEDE